MTSLAAQIPGHEIRVADRVVRFPGKGGWGGWLGVKSLHKPNDLRSEGLDLLVVDEAAHFGKLQEAWQQALRPTLTDKLGRALFISTPKGRNYFYELYKRAEQSSDWESFHFPTSASPYITQGEIEAARLELPELVFRQEYEAKFVQIAGALIRREWINILESAPAFKREARGWDLAASTKTSADFTVGVRLGVTSDGRRVVTDVVRGRWEWPEALNIIKRTAASDGPGVTQCIEDNGQQKGMLQLIRRDPNMSRFSFRGVTEILRKPMPDKVTRANMWIPFAEQGLFGILRANWNAAYLDVLCTFSGNKDKRDDDVDGTSAANIATSVGGGWSWGLVK
jgi:predicted phage terminase large subunit-like protein